MTIQLTVDAVVFTIQQTELKVLLIKRKKPPFKGMYAIPGGFVRDSEETHDAVLRELSEETGVSDIFLHFFNTYASVGRDPRGRVVSMGYLALISSDKLHLEASTDAEEARWFRYDSLPKLAFDHDDVIRDALKHLRFEIQATNIAAQLLPREFSLTELQTLYETILGIELDKRNFRKRLRNLDILEATPHMRREGAHRPARLYRFKDREYHPLKDKVHIFL